MKILLENESGSLEELWKKHKKIKKERNDEKLNILRGQFLTKLLEEYPDCLDNSPMVSIAIYEAFEFLKERIEEVTCR